MSQWLIYIAIGGWLIGGVFSWGAIWGEIQPTTLKYKRFTPDYVRWKNIFAAEVLCLLGGPILFFMNYKKRFGFRWRPLTKKDIDKL